MAGGRWLHVKRAATVAAALALAPTLDRSPALAQAQAILRGRVVEDGTMQPLATVEVAVTRAGGSRWVTRTDARGAFALIVAPGRHVVRARQIGFAEAHVEVDLPPGLEHGRRVELFMEPLPYTLGAVAVTGHAALRASAMQRVAERRFLGLGLFLEHGEILRRGQPPVPDLLRGLPGVHVMGSGYTSVVTMSRARRGCFPIVYLDGHRLNRAFDALDAQQSVLAMIPGRTVETVEVYRGPAETPGEFGGSSSPCGVLAVWSVQPTPSPRDARAPPPRR